MTAPTPVPDEAPRAVHKDWPGDWGSWPYYHLVGHWRNGREAGAYAAGVVLGSPEKCARVEVAKDQADGAVISMVSGGLSVQAHADNGEALIFAVWSAYEAWAAEPLG